MAEKFIIIVDAGKMVEVLGNFPIAVETLPFAWLQTKKALEALGASVSLRAVDHNKPVVTDNNNYILDAKFSHVLKPARLEQVINNLPGVVENGLFRAEKTAQIWVGTNEGVMIYPEG